ncbi:hypothetical protein [Brevibacillus sp. SYSU BS000544]|uniref:hypothetical protein n=1 Tax=Brevibacillus sp. SYSU BS000544 TaxID=3416443 RepID=UPI003CE5A079
MKKFLFAIYTLATLAVGIHLTDGGGHTDPPDVDGFALSSKYVQIVEGGTHTDPPDVEDFV